MSTKLLIIAPTLEAGRIRAGQLGYSVPEVRIIRALDDIHGYVDKKMAYAEDAYLMEDFYDILDYARTHRIIALRTGDGTDDWTEMAK